MAKFLATYLMALLLPIFIGNSDSLFSQESIKSVIRNFYNTRLCSIDRHKEVLVLIEIGPVALKDSLYGFDFSVKYDPALIKFYAPVYINTISEFFEFKDINFGLDYGKVKGYALGEFPSGGNKPLIGFLGKYLDNCSIRTPIVLEYLEFTGDFEKTILPADTLWIKPDIVENPEYKFECVLHADEIVFDIEEELKSIGGKINFSTIDEINTISVNIRIDSDNYYIEDFMAVNSSFWVVETNILHDGMNAKLRLNESINNGYEYEIKIRELRKDPDKQPNLTIIPLKLSECNCVSKYMSDNLTIKTLKKKDADTTIASISDNLIASQFRVYDNGSVIMIENLSKYDINEMHLFNYEGKILKSMDTSLGRILVIERSDLPAGAYFIRLHLSNSELVKKTVLIYN